MLENSRKVVGVFSDLLPKKKVLRDQRPQAKEKWNSIAQKMTG